MRFVIIGGQLFGIGSERAEVFLVVLDNCIGNQVQGLLAQFFVAALQAEQAVTFGVGRRNVGKGQVFQAVFNNRVKLYRLVFVVFVISLGGNQVVDVGKGFVRLIACHCCGDGSGSDGAGAVSPRFFFGRNGIEGSLTVFRGVFRLRYRLAQLRRPHRVPARAVRGPAARAEGCRRRGFWRSLLPYPSYKGC